jgi:hypothetical protein
VPSQIACLTPWPLQKALADEKEAKGQSLQLRTELDTRLEKTIKSLDAVTAEKELTKATLADTRKDLEREKVAGTKLGEQVIDLSKQLEDQTARAVKAEDSSKQLQKGATCSDLGPAHCGCEDFAEFGLESCSFVYRPVSLTNYLSSRVRVDHCNWHLQLQFACVVILHLLSCCSSNRFAFCPQLQTSVR